MVDLTTQYLGITLKNPMVPSSSPLTGNLDGAKQLEDAGAAAIVLPSLFEEALIHEQENMERFLEHQDIGHFEASSFLPTSHHFSSTLDQYLERIAAYKSTLSIPVIGSLNGTTRAGWIDHAKDLEEAGADALELNLYGIQAEKLESSDDIERRYLSLTHDLHNTINIPFIVKLSPQFTSLIHFTHHLEQAGAGGVSLFNRFYQPDIDLDTLSITPKIHLSSPYESLLRIRWIALLRAHSEKTIAATGGFHGYQEALKALLAGADVVHLCSVLLEHGADKITEIMNDIEHWMNEKEYESIEQLKGSLSYKNAINPSLYERANYLQVLDSYSPSPGVKV